MCTLIENDPLYPTEEKKRRKMISYYLDTNPNATWSLLAILLYEQENYDCLEVVKKYIHRTTG